MIDIQDATGSIKSLPPKRKEEADGQLMSVDVEPTIDLFVKPEQFDGFYDCSRGRPSEMYWTPPKADAKDQVWYLRWFNVKKVVLEVPEKQEHMLKLSTVKLKEESDSDYSRSRIEVILLCVPRSCTAELSSNFARLSLKVRGHAPPDDQAKLLELFRREKLNISFYQRQEDLADKTPAPPRQEAAPAAPAAAPTDDKLYPKLVEFIDEMKALDEGCITLPEVTKKLRVGINRALQLLAAAVRAGVVLEKNPEGEYLFPLNVPDTPSAAAAQSPAESDSVATDTTPPAPGQPRTPKCVNEWDGEQWVDNKGVPVVPQPPAPEFTNVRDLGVEPDLE